MTKLKKTSFLIVAFALGILVFAFYNVPGWRVRELLSEVTESSFSQMSTICIDDVQQTQVQQITKNWQECSAVLQALQDASYTFPLSENSTYRYEKRIMLTFDIYKEANNYGMISVNLHWRNPAVDSYTYIFVSGTDGKNNFFKARGLDKLLQTSF